MKIVKLLIVVCALLSSAQAMADVGPMQSRADYSDGEYICPKIAAKRAAEAAALAAQNANDGIAKPADAASAN